MTLLALGLPVPEAGTNNEVLASVGHNAGEYIAFLISFAVIGRYWVRHLRLFRYVREDGGMLVRWNLLWLLTIVLTPFATRVLSGDGAFETRFTFYAIVQSLSGLFFLRMAGVEGAPPAAPGRAGRDSADRHPAAPGAGGRVPRLDPGRLRDARAYVCWIAAPIGAGFARRLAHRCVRAAA